MLSYFYLYEVIEMTTIDYYLNDMWSQTLKYIADSGQIAESVLPYFDSKLASLNDSEAVVTVPAFINFAIMSEHSQLIENCLEEVLGKHLSVRVVQQDEYNKATVSKNLIVSDFLTRKIDTNQTFANFVVGRSNAQAQVAAMTCASNLGVYFNPLFYFLQIFFPF